MTAITVNFDSILEITTEQLYQLSQKNPDLQFERNQKGELLVISPTGGETGKCNFNIALKLGIWNEQTQLGVCFDSSTGFHLPNNATRSPDVAWIPIAKWNNLTLEQQKKFLPLCPDFAIELRSPEDSWKFLQGKMEEYIDNGMRLGWLINRQNRQVEIYRQGQVKQVLDNPITVSGENVLPGFILELKIVW
ncbi:Uma2 family endonuclease [Oscillatoria salina]|uniref:Uma2 family endonuclease n=1 Tax=Oscillatoria salina TaxID=331517 RepID=UPI0013BE6C6D|nr:Uma2 family endonuclease [Oscillatoria salina]MBZ8180897.1 Uma2 family endonuclease [Oscillatoria salina IIICB1]NET90327.1 Uma2 family endonuclease [Kamptonema sp. SIO1D9]